MALLLFLFLAVMASACRNEPKLVYVPATEPDVELIVRASKTTVAAGEPVILRAERRNHGAWRQVERESLAAGECWVGRPPEEREPEIADNVHWTALPGEHAKFNVVYRDDRTRELVFSMPGVYIVTSGSSVWCRSRRATGKPLKIVVRP